MSREAALTLRSSCASDARNRRRARPIVRGMRYETALWLLALSRPKLYPLLQIMLVWPMVQRPRARA